MTGSTVTTRSDSTLSALTVMQNQARAFKSVEGSQKTTGNASQQKSGASSQRPSFKSAHNATAVRSGTTATARPGTGSTSSTPSTSNAPSQADSTRPRTTECSYCKEKHFIANCPAFLELNVDARKQRAITNRLCFNCLGYHSSRDCRSQSSFCAIVNSTKSTAITSTLLATATSILKSPTADLTVRILIDPGSELTFIYADVASQIATPPDRANQTRRLRSDSPAELSTELTLKVKTQLARFQLLREMCNDVHSTDTLLSEEVVIEHLNYADSVHKALLKEHSYFEVTRAQGIHTS
ncbi:hypothetical protein PV328_011147 [Microctonus aethiopoides]|uniref:Uncharacterized protein n=1 Tax=Microctonus aethiopoides TaxID=144406 RepID=A0AA39C3W8_9HYME|nr:hypothetical protein PV328_011147 [Microctonus aethiopoides]